MTRHSLPFLLVFLLATPSAAVKPGDKAKNLKVLPAWTMARCPTALKASYTAQEALQLKRLDNDCALWKAQAALLGPQTKALEALQGIVSTYKTEHQLDQERIQALVKQLKAEIAEKNKYKYKSSYGWLYVAVGAGLAAVGLSFGVGVWIAK